MYLKERVEDTFDRQFFYKTVQETVIMNITNLPSSGLLPQNFVPVNKEKEEQDIKRQMSIELSSIRLPREEMLDEVLLQPISDIISGYVKSQDPFDLFKEFYKDMITLKLSDELRKKLWVNFAIKTQPDCFKIDELLKNNIDKIIEVIGEGLTATTDEVIADVFKSYTRNGGKDQDKQKHRELSAIYPYDKRARKFQHIIQAEEFIRRPDNHCILESLDEAFFQNDHRMKFVLPNLLKECSNLTSLVLKDIDISSPLDISNFTKLKILYVKNCKLASLPDYFNKFSELQSIEFSNNQIINIPETLIQKIKEGSIITLSLSKNQFSIEEVKKIREAERIGNTKRENPMMMLL